MSIRSNAETNEARRKELKHLEEMKVGIDLLNSNAARIEQSTSAIIVKARSILALMTAATIFLSAILLALIWLAYIDLPRSPGSNVAQIVSTPRPSSVATCWKTKTIAFAQGESDRCETHSPDDCHWTEDLSPDADSNTDAEATGTLNDYIDNVPHGNAIQILVYGGHDATRLKRGRYDSNFDLAFKRASAVIRDLRSSKALEGRQRETIYIPVAGSTPPSPCVSGSGEPDNWDKRRPRVVVFSSRAQQ